MWDSIKNEIIRSHHYRENFSNPMSEWLFENYNGKGVTLSIVMPPVLFFICMLVSYFGNGMVILATIRKTKLRGSYNIFVSLSCLGDILHQNSHWFYLINMTSGNNFIPYHLCYYINLLMVQGVTLSVFMTFFVGVDRLIGVTCPIFYLQIKTRPYVAVCLACSITFGFYTHYLGYQQLNSPFGKEPVMCSIIDSMGAGALPWFNTCVLLNILDVLIYTIVWIQLKVNTKASDTMRRVFKSLLVMMMVVGFGWLINALVRSVIIPYGHIPVSQWFFWASYCGFLVNIASTLNFFILFWFSSEYQAAFISLIPWLARFRSSDVQALPSSYNDRSRSRVDRLHSIVKNGSSSQYDNIL